jgi:generic methyl-transferase
MLCRTELFCWFETSQLAQQLWAQEQYFFQAALQTKQPNCVLQLGLMKAILNTTSTNCWIKQSVDLPADVLALDCLTPWQNAQFDVIVAPHLLDYSPNTEQLLHELYRIVQAQGCLILTAFNPHSLWRFRLHEYIPDVRLGFTLHWVKQVAQDVGWHIAQEKFLYCLPPVVLPKEQIYRQWAEYAGSHLWRYGSAVYALVLTKQVVQIQAIDNKNPEWIFQAA